MKLLIISIFLIIFTRQSLGFFVSKDEVLTNFQLNQSQDLLYLENMAHSAFTVFERAYPKERIIFEIQNTDSVNAYASFDDNDFPLVSISTGLLKESLIDLDTIALIICHEVGHFYGGSPKQFRGRSTKLSWSSAEGQADFYATAVCAKKIFPLLPKVVQTKELGESSKVENELLDICKSEECLRIGLASYKLASIYAKIKFWDQVISLKNKDRTISNKINRGHPNPQCRFDTMILGVLCDKTHIQNQGENPSLSCADSRYKRPTCWYRSSSFRDTLQNYE